MYGLGDETSVEGDRGGGNFGVMGAGSLQEAGEKGAGDRIPKGVEAGRNSNVATLHNISQ